MKKYPSFAVLIVDDERHVRKSYQMTLRGGGISNTVELDDPCRALRLMREQEIGTVLLDLIMPLMPGQELLKEIVKEFPDVPVIIITGLNEIETAVQCVKSGAFDYLVKPLDNDRLLTSVAKAIDVHELRRENSMMRERFLKDQTETHPAFASIITNNAKMKSLFNYAEAIAKSAQPTLITGETGVGKELFAKAVHDLSGRKGKYVALNVAGLDSNMFSDTLFGHLKGAFTGADSARKGAIESAADGTVFLDEIGDLSMETQVKLLRLLQEREYAPLGADDTRFTNAKFILATHCQLEKKVREGTFREDLYYRLRTHHVQIPPLRERQDDIPLLLDYFLEEAAKDLGKKKPTCPPQLITLLKNYAFPGNVREFRALIHDALSRHKSKVLSLNLFHERLRIGEDSLFEVDAASSEDIIFPDRLPTLKQATEALVNEAMRRADNNQSIAARFLGVTQQALSHRLKKARESEA